MSDNTENDNEGFSLDDGNFDSFEDKKSTLGGLWSKPSFKVGVVVVAAVAIFGSIILFGGGGGKQPDASLVQSPSDVTAAPGTSEATPAYIEAVKEANEARTEEAMREGTSSLPTPIAPPVGRVSVVEQNSGEEDPLQRWRRLQEERLQRELQKTQTLEQAPNPGDQAAEDQNRKEAIQKMSEGMAQQMQAILETKNQVKISQRKITDPSILENMKKQQQQQAAAATAAANKGQTEIQEIILPAGEIAYAQLITEANSDIDTPILAQIAGGPLNGARILGSFKMDDQTSEEVLTLSFDTIILDGISYDINAVAVDPSTTKGGLATDVNHHYLKRIALPAAAAFVEGLSQAISESGRTSVFISNDVAVSSEGEKNDKQEVASGVQEAGQKLGEIFDDMADKAKVTVVVAAGTPIGVLFLEPVIKDDKSNKQRLTGDANSHANNASGNPLAQASSLAQEVANRNVQ